MRYFIALLDLPPPPLPPEMMEEIDASPIEEIVERTETKKPKIVHVTQHKEAV